VHQSAAGEGVLTCLAPGGAPQTLGRSPTLLQAELTFSRKAAGVACVVGPDGRPRLRVTPLKSVYVARGGGVGGAASGPGAATAAAEAPAGPSEQQQQQQQQQQQVETLAPGSTYTVSGSGHRAAT